MVTVRTFYLFQEIKSILRLFNINMKWVEKPQDDPFWVVELDSEEDARKIASRSVTLRCVIKLWAGATNINDLHEILKTYPNDMISSYLHPDISFRVKVETFGKTCKMREKVDKIEMFNYLPAEGPVKLHDPDVTFYYIEYYGLNPNHVPDIPYYFYFGVWVSNFFLAYILKNQILTKEVFISDL